MVVVSIGAAAITIGKPENATAIGIVGAGVNVSQTRVGDVYPLPNEARRTKRAEL